MWPPSGEASTAHSCGPNGSLMRPARVFQSAQSLLQPEMLEFRILGPLEVLDEGCRWRSAAGISARARVPAPARERARLDRAPRRPALGRAAAADRDDVAPERRLAATQAARPRPAVDAAAGLRAGARPASSSTWRDSSGWSARRASRSRTERALLLRRGARAVARRRRSQTSSRRRSRSREIHRLEDLRLGVLEERIDADLELGARRRARRRVEALVAPPAARAPARRT